MDNELTSQEFEKLCLRFFNRNPHYHGTMIIKWFDGGIANVKIEDSIDIKEIKEKKLILRNSEMFIKKGASFKSDDKSSKIISTVEVDEDKKIVKESIIKEDKKEKEDEVNENK